jgi:hypothetical protein
MLLKVSASRSRMLGRRLGCVSQISRTKNTTSSALDTCTQQRTQYAYVEEKQASVSKQHFLCKQYMSTGYIAIIK